MTSKNIYPQLKYARTHRVERNAYMIKYLLRLKIEAFAHYGKDGKLQCCWPDCDVIDIDVLTLDHVEDNGAKDRKQNGRRGGTSLCVLLRKQNYPAGYQTLCANHQLKKEILRRRSARELRTY